MPELNPTIYIPVVLILLNNILEVSIPIVYIG
jgi:hypothetical protein